MKQHQKVKVLLTGGHAATTALAVIEQLVDDKTTDWDISWVGPKQALSHKGIKPFELDLFPKLGVKVYAITAGKLQSKFTRHTIPNLIKIPFGFVHAFKTVLQIRPQIVISFGGFVSVPVVFSSWLLGIPIIVQEQISGLGLANKISAMFAKKVAVSRESSIPLLPKDKTVLIGVPLTKEILSIKPKKVISRTPTIYITGGSRGAQRINNLVFDCLPEILKDFYVYHQTGALDINKAKLIKSNLPKHLQEKYTATDFVNPLNISEVYKKIDILIGRSGANTVAEALYLCIPSIYIPIPWSTGDEQTKNARYVEKIGVAKLLPESQMSSVVLVDFVNDLHKKWGVMNKKAQEFDNIDTDASVKFLELVRETLK